MTSTETADVLAEAKEIVLEGQCVAFIGAGLSIPPGSRWMETVREIASCCGVNFDDNNLPKVIDKCFEAKPTEYKKALKDIFEQNKATARTALIFLPRLPFKTFITTNFDPWLQNYFRESDIEKQCKYPYIKMSEGLSKAIYYIHGYYDSESNNYDHKELVFGENSFSDAYGMDSLLPGFLLNLLVWEHILFISFDPTQDNFREMLIRAENIKMKWKEKDSRKKFPKRFILWPTLITPNMK
jgi:hypothetical protein